MTSPAAATGREGDGIYIAECSTTASEHSFCLNLLTHQSCPERVGGPGYSLTGATVTGDVTQDVTQLYVYNAAELSTCRSMPIFTISGTAITVYQNLTKYLFCRSTSNT